MSMGEIDPNTVVGFIKVYSDFQREIGRIEGVSMMLPEDQSAQLWDVAQNISDMVDDIFGVPKDDGEFNETEGDDDA